MFNLFWRPYVPGFRVKSHDDVPGTRTACRGAQVLGPMEDSRMQLTQRYLDAAQTEMPYGMSLSMPAPDAIVQSTPSIGLAGFRVEFTGPWLQRQAGG